jgi:hypothetical protein
MFRTTGYGWCPTLRTRSVRTVLARASAARLHVGPAAPVGRRTSARALGTERATVLPDVRLEVPSSNLGAPMKKRPCLEGLFNFGRLGRLLVGGVR